MHHRYVGLHSSFQWPLVHRTGRLVTLITVCVCIPTLTGDLFHTRGFCFADLIPGLCCDVEPLSYRPGSLCFWAGCAAALLIMLISCAFMVVAGFLSSVMNDQCGCTPAVPGRAMLIPVVFILGLICGDGGSTCQNWVKTR